MGDTRELGKGLEKNMDVAIKLKGGLKIVLRKGVFIPDRESFYFIEVIKRFIYAKKKYIHSIAEIGTGSGIISVSIASEFPNIKVYGFDTSSKAVKLTRDNALMNGVKLQLFKNRDGIWVDAPKSVRADLIVSNPPYVGDWEYFSKTFRKDYPDFDYQPVGALRSYDAEGIRAYVEIFKAAKRRKTQYIIFRCNTQSTDRIKQVLMEAGCISARKLMSSTKRSHYLLVTLLP
jgi:release factor glutamine methyltransferase